MSGMLIRLEIERLDGGGEEHDPLARDLVRIYSTEVATPTISDGIRALRRLPEEVLERLLVTFLLETQEVDE